MADLVGRRLGPYEIRAVIGRGGMATVYRAFQPALHREVALKVLNTVMSHDSEFVTRFHREALAAGGLDHPNILRIYDAGVFEDHQYIVMALAPGGTLADRLRQSAMPYNAMADLIAQIADALGYAHRHGIVHRDIKPSNILLDEEGRPLLADFGIAQALTSMDQRMTQTGASIGTPEYMSPEQAEGWIVDGRSDLFSLGIVLYQMATGKMPFKADTTLATMFQVVHHAPPSPRSVTATIPAYLDAIIQKALAKRPEDRFETGQEMAQALRQRQVVTVPAAAAEWDQATRAVRATSSRAEPPRRPPTAPRAVPPARPRDRRPLWIGLLALALVVAIGGGYLAAVSLTRKPPPTPAAVATAIPSVEVAAAVADPPTDTPEPEANPTPTRKGGVVVNGAPAAPPTETAAPEATQTPVVVIITVVSTLPPTVPPTPELPTATATNEPEPVATAPLATAPPTATAAPVAPGVVLDFETFGAWRIGNEQHGAFTAGNAQVHGGQVAARLAYRFPAVANNYVVFRRSPVAPVAGQPAGLAMWVYGDGAGHFLNAWVRDAGGEVRQFTFGRVTHTGWQEMVAPLDVTAPWPQTHISGADNGKLDFPVSVDGLVLDGVPDGGGPFNGELYFDDMRTTDTIPAPITETGNTGATTDAAQPTAAPPPVAAGNPTGRIVFANAAGGVSVLDVAAGTTYDLAANARQPDVTADGRVAVDGVGGGRDNQFVVRIDGSANWTSGAHPEDSYPSWSPSGVSATFHSSLQGDGRDRIYVQRDMGHAEEPRRLQINKTDVFGKYPTWLENWRIAFTGCNYWAEGSRCGIWTTNSDDSGAPALVVDGPSDVTTDSGNGLLLFSSQRSGNWDVYAVDQNGGGLRNLTDSPGQDVGATFSPDLNWIAFISNRDGWGIWVMNVDGSNPRKLLATPGFGPNWAEERLAWAR